MATQYTSILKLALPVTGELTGTWGDVVNDNITSMVEQAVAGLATINTWASNSHTLTVANGTSSESRCAMLILDDDGLGNPAAAATVICPAASKLYVVKNICGQTATIKTAAGTGVAIPNNGTAIVFCDGTNVVEASTYASTVNIDGGTIDNTVIGGTTAAAGSFTTLDASGTVTGNGNWVIGNADTDTVTLGASFVNGTVLRSAKSAGNTLALAAYDVDGAAYTNLITLTANNTPTLAITSTGTGTINNMSIGATTASTGAFTTLSASSTVSGTGFSTYLASPPAIGGTAPAAGSFTTLSANSTVTISGLTASQAVFTNASKQLVSNAITGTGNVVMSASPTLTGTITAAAITASGTVTLNGALAANGGVTLGDASSDTLTITSNTASINNTLTFAYEDATTNTVVDTIRIRRTSSGVPALGIGSGVAFEVETAAANTETGATLDIVTTDVTAASEDFDFVVNLMAAGAAAAEKFRVTSAGEIKSASATFTGTMNANALGGNAATGGGASGTWGISITGDAGSVDGKSFGTFTAAGGILYATSTTAASGTAAGTSGQPLLSGAAGAPTWGTLSAGAGGTGQTSYAVGDILYASTTSALSKLAGVATGNALISGGVNTAPSWGKIGLTTHISGTLAVANGGTGLTALTALSLPVVNTTNTLTTITLTAGQSARINAGGTAWEAFTPGTGGGSVTSITAGTGLSGGTITTSGTISVTTNGISNTLFRQSDALSVVGRSVNTTGDVADIAAAADNQVLRRSGTTLGFGAIALNQANAVTGTLAIANGGTNSTATPTDGGIAFGNGTSFAFTAAGTAGQVLVSAGTNDPGWATLEMTNIPGAAYKKSVRVATTANITLSGTQAIDGITVAANDRVLVKNQTAPAENGIYVVAAGAWTRATDADTVAEIAAGLVPVDSGTSNGGELWTTNFKTTDALGTTAMNWYEVVYNSGTWEISTTGSAAALTTSRSLWGQSFNGSADITAPLLPAAGAVGAPAFSTSGDTNTGMYFPSADNLAFSTGGTLRLQVNNGSVDVKNQLLRSGNLSLIAWTTSGSAFDSAAATYTDTTTAAAGVVASRAVNTFNTPTLASSNAITVTTAATVYISGAPTAGTNTTITTPYALWVDSGNSQFDGDATVNGTLNVRTAIDLADNDILRFGDADDWKLSHDGTSNLMDLVVGDLVIRDNTTNRITIGRTTGDVTTTGVFRPQAGSVTSPSFSTSGDTNTGMFFPAADTIAFAEGGAEAMRIDSSGNVGIGTTGPEAGEKLRVATSSGNNGITLEATGVSPYLRFLDTGSSEWSVGIPDSSGALAFVSGRNTGAAGTERMRITSAGDVGIGTTTPLSKLDVNGNVCVSNGTGFTSTNSLIRRLYAPAGATNQFEVVAIDFLTGSFADNGVIRFLTNAGLGLAERMRLTTSGSLLLGDATGDGGKLSIHGAAGFAGTGISINETSANARRLRIYQTADGVVYDATFGNVDNKHLWYTASAERMRLDVSGNLLRGQTSAGLANNNGFCADQAGYIVQNHVNGSASGLRYVYFGYNGVEIGSITQNGTTAVSFNTTSDYRLKENVKPMQNALATVAQLNPVTYTWKADGSAGQGFIAHELQAVVPDAVTGEKDAVDKDGKPQYQGVDTSFLVATLTAAIQEQQQMINELRNEIAALKGA